ncbi:ubiquitin ligase with a HECT domain at the C-terminus [Cryptosporidium sp. chipmunk genotype I]|uniref:ubiquitin ligase with a HECT domain at the C-terminus n=1 Tax=Cryptosporidium sp. chipmunk genotype I TaxID=1280935 RepID=UPI00351AA1A8|nr:ubiquitin ligase with a HECT domain at the C-terminus [Cryptosporidium sp. chipmunk genotype I]
MSIQKSDLDKIVRERCVNPMEIFLELKKLDVSPSELAESYILGGLGQLSCVESSEGRKEYVSRMISNSIKRVKRLKERNNMQINGRNVGYEDSKVVLDENRVLKMDPFGSVSEDYGEWLKESLVRHYGSMVECDKEIIKNLAEQMNQFLSLSRASSVEETSSMKRISEVLLEENVIVRSENKGLYGTGKLSNAEVINFPIALLKLRESVLSLTQVRDLNAMKGEDASSLKNGLRYKSRGLIMNREQEKEIYFGKSLDDVFFEKRYSLIFKEDSGSELRTMVQDLSEFLRSCTGSGQVGRRGRMIQSSKLANVFSSTLGYISREYFNIEQTNLIMNLCLRVIIKLTNMSFLLEILQELTRLKGIIGDQFVLEIDSLIWSKLQFLLLASSFNLLIFDSQNDKKGGSLKRVSNSWRESEEIFGQLFSKHILFECIPLFGCNIVQFHLISDSRIFNEVIQEDLVRSRIEISMEDLSSMEMINDLKSHKEIECVSSIRKFDTCAKGGRETRLPGSLLMLEFCDNRINIYETKQINGSYHVGNSSEATSSLEFNSTKQLEKSFVGDYLVELVTYIENQEEKIIQNCLSILVNGEIIHTLKFGKEMTSTLKIQVTMIDEIFLEIQNSQNLTKKLVNDILLRNRIIDYISKETSSSEKDLNKLPIEKNNELNFRIKTSIGSLLIFLSSLWRGRISKDPRAIFELHLNHYQSQKDSILGNDDLSRLLIILNDELNVITKFCQERKNEGKLQVSEIQSDIQLVLNLVFILRDFVSRDEYMVRYTQGLESPGNSSFTGENFNIGQISSNLENCFHVISRLMDLILHPELEGFQWLCRITAINALSKMSYEVIKTIFHSISLENVLKFIRCIMNSKRSEVNEILDLIKCLDEANIFSLIVTRLLKSRQDCSNGNRQHSEFDSSFFILLRELLKRNNDFSSRENYQVEISDENSQFEHKLSKESILSKNLTDWIKIQIETEKRNYSTLDWMYKYYDSFKNKTSKRIMSVYTPTYRNNCDNRIILNILINIFVTNGMKISQANIIELIADRFEKELHFAKHSKRKDRNYGLNSKEALETLEESDQTNQCDQSKSSAPIMRAGGLTGDHGAQGRIRRLSSSMNLEAKDVKVPRDQHPIEERLDHNACHQEDTKEDGFPIEALRDLKPSRDFLKNDKNIIFWREVIYQIVNLLLRHSQDWLETHNHYKYGEGNSFRFLDSKSPEDRSLRFNDSDSYSKDTIKNVMQSVYKDNSGIYTSSEIIWFGHLLKYGVTEALGNVISYSLCCSDLLMSCLKRSEENIESLQYVHPVVVGRIKRQLFYLLNENLVTLNLGILREMMKFNEKFSDFSRELFDHDLLTLRGGILNQDSMHSVAESHIQFNWLLSQLFVWASIDISVVLKDYLLNSIKEKSLIQLSASIHPLIFRNVIENLLEYKGFDNFSLRLSNLMNPRSDWIDNLLSILSDQENENKADGKTESKSQNLITKIINSDLESIQSLGSYWKTFHPKYRNLQLAVYSVIMHLFGVDNISAFDNNKIKVLEMSLSISKKCCSQLLSNWQAQSSSNGQENIDFQEQAKIKEKFIETTISRCKWIIENVPFNLCNRYRNSIVTQVEDCENLDVVFSKSEQDDIPGSSHPDSKNGVNLDGKKKNRRATDTNIIFNSNSHHIDMLKQLLSIRRRSSQQSFEQPIITSMGSFGIPNSSSSSISVSSRLNRNNSDPSLFPGSLSSSNWKEENSLGPNNLQDHVYDLNLEEASDSEMSSSQVLDLYIHFIMNGPANIQDMNKVIKTEIFSSFLKLMTLEQIYKITSCHKYFKVSLHSFLRYEGWLYIRLAQLVMIYDFKFRSLLELCLEKRNKRRKSSSSMEGLPQILSTVDIEKRPLSGETLRYMGGIVNNIQEWISQIFSNKILQTKQFHQNITENDELWFDSSLRLVILYFMIVSKKSNDEISLLRNINSCIFPFIQEQVREKEMLPFPIPESSSSFDSQITLGDTVTGLIIAEIKSQDEKSLIRIFQEQGYQIEQIIQGSNGDQNNTRIFLFIQRLSSLPMYSIPIFADKHKFESFYRINYGSNSNIFIFKSEYTCGFDPVSENGQMLFYYQFQIRSMDLFESLRPSDQSFSAYNSKGGFIFESLVPLHTCNRHSNKDLEKDQRFLRLNNTVHDITNIDEDKGCGCTIIRLYSKKIRIDQVYLSISGGYGGFMSRSNSNIENRFILNNKSGDGSEFKEQADLFHSSMSEVNPSLLPSSNLVPSLSLSSSSSSSSPSSSSSIILLNSLNRINSMILNNSYITRLKKRGWILFKTYLLTTLMSEGSEKTIKERVISYTFSVLTSISEKIRELQSIKGSNSKVEEGFNINDELSEELELYVEDILNILIYSIQLTCYSAKLRRAETEYSQEKKENGLLRINQNSGDISYSILIKFLKLHNGEKHTLKDLWTRNSKIEGKISVLLTECIRQCTLKDLTLGINQKEGFRKITNKSNEAHFNALNLQENQEWILQINEIAQNNQEPSENIRNFSVTLPDLHLFPRSFLKCISSELISYNSENQDVESKSRNTPIHQNSIAESGSGSLNSGTGLASNREGDLHPIVGNGGGNDVPSSFRNHPHSSTFIGALPNENFNVNIDGRIVQCDQASMGGGIVICRAPLTFRGLQSTGLSVPPNILSFRVLGIGRFGITVAPSNVLTMSLEEVFQRNDVVGLRPQPPTSSSSTTSNSNVYQLPENMFALEIPYAEGTVIDIRYGVSSNSSGSILRSEIFIGGESIGSVLEVQFNELAQISEDTRLSVIFVILDPLTILYEGLPFSTRYRRRSSTWFESIHSGRVVTQEQIQQLALGSSSSSSVSPSTHNLALKDLDLNNKKQLFNISFLIFIQNIKLFQEILVSSHALLSGLKDNLVKSIQKSILSISSDFEMHLETFFSVKTSDDENLDSLELSILSDRLDFDKTSQLLDSLIEKTLLLCSICTIFGVDLNPLEEQDEPGMTLPIIHPDSLSFKESPKTHFERDLLLRRRCSNITYGDLPWLSSSIDSGVLCYSSLFGLKLSHLELILEGFYQLFKVKLIHQLYFLLGTENLKICISNELENKGGKILELQKHLLDSLSVLISRSSLVVSLISRVILEFCPGNDGPKLSEKMKDILFGFFSLIGNFSLYSCGENSQRLKSSKENRKLQLFNIFYSKDRNSQGEKNQYKFKPIETKDEKSLYDIITSTGVECEQNFPSDSLQDKNEFSSSNRFYDLPEIQMRTILLTKDCNTLWKWILRQGFVTRDNHPSLSPAIKAIRHLDNSIYGKLSMNQRIFNLEGSNPITAKKLVLKSNGTTATWSIKISAIDTLCNICGIIPDHINKLLFQDVKQGPEEQQEPEQSVIRANKEIISERFYQIIRIMRICTYFIIRGREDFVFPAAHQNMDDNNHLSPSPDYWLMFKRSIYNDIHNTSEISIKDSTRKILNRIDSESALTDKLYSWQRLIYITSCHLDLDVEMNQNTDQMMCQLAMKKNQMQRIITNFLKTEIIFHLVGSLIQIYSIRIKEASNSQSASGNHSKQLKYSSLSPSVYVAHWLMDQFIRHPLCPSFIRSSIVNRLTWNFLFSLITNGVHIPTKLAIDSCRMTYWITNHRNMVSGLDKYKKIQDQEYDRDRAREIIDQSQGILDSICYCVSCILSLYESKVNFDGENPLVNVNNLPVFRELILGKVPITQLGWDYFTSAEDYKPINRQKINTTLVCHFMACSARCILDSSDEYTLLPLPHILSFFNRYLSFISISNHLMLSTSDTAIVSNNEINKMRSLSGSKLFRNEIYDEIFNDNIKPNTLFPWKYIQNTLNYINPKSLLLSLGENPIFQEYHSVLRINYGNSLENDLIEKSKRRNLASNGYLYPNQSTVNLQLSKLHKRNSGFIGFKLKPLKLEFDYERNHKVPRILYSINNNGINGLIYEYGGYEIGQKDIQLKEVVKHSFENGEIQLEERLNINKNEFRVILNSGQKSLSYCLRSDNLLYVNGLHSSSVKALFRLNKLSESVASNGIHPIKLILVGGIVFEKQLSEIEISSFYTSWIQGELFQKLKPKKRDTNIKSELLSQYSGYLGSILYSYYDDKCLNFGGEAISQSLTRIRATSSFSIQGRSKQKWLDVVMVFQNRLLILEVNGTPVAITGLPPQARFILPIIYLESNKEAFTRSSVPISPNPSSISHFLESADLETQSGVASLIYCDVQLNSCLTDIFIPYTQIISKINYLPIISENSESQGKDQLENGSVKWIPTEFKHRFKIQEQKASSSGGAKSDYSSVSLTMLKIRAPSRKGGSLDQISIESSTPRLELKCKKKGLCVIGYMYPNIPSGVSFCSSSNTTRDLYSPALFKNWKNWILPGNTVWTVNRSEDDIQIQNNNDDECYLNDNGEISIKSRLFKSLDPCKSFSITFKVQRRNELLSSSGHGDGLSQTFGVGIDWLDGMYRFVWLNDGRFIVPSLPPLPFEISKLYKEYKIPTNHEIIIENLDSSEFLDSRSQKVSIPKYGLYDQITIEFQPSIPALIFFKNGQYSFSFNFTEFYKKICGNLSLSLESFPQSLSPAVGGYLEEISEQSEFSQSLSEKMIWILRTLFVMTILQNDVLVMSHLIAKYAKYLIDLEKKDFLFKVLITEDLYNNILNCIPKCISSSKMTIRSLLSNIYDYVMFPDPREFFSMQEQALRWDLLNTFFSMSTLDETDLHEFGSSSGLSSTSLSSLKVFSEKRSQKVVMHETPFWLACWIGNEHIVQYLLKFVHVDNRSLNLLDTDNNLSLYIGCYGMVIEGREREDSGVPVNSNATNTNYSSFSSSSSSISNLNPRPYNHQVRYLIQTENRKMNIQRERSGTVLGEFKGYSLFQTGLMASIMSGNARIAYILMAVYDSDVNIQDRLGNTSYHFAVAFGHLDIIQLLSFKGVNPYILNNHDQFAGSLYRTVFKKFLERDRSQGGTVQSENGVDMGLVDQPGTTSGSGPSSGTAGSKMLEWAMIPSPPNISFHGEKEDIAEFTQQYEKLYCFSVCNSQKIDTEKESQKSFINMNIQNKSNLLPPYQYPWPGLFSDCQIVAMVDLYSPTSSETDNSEIYISIESLEIGGVLQNKSSYLKDLEGVKDSLKHKPKNVSYKDYFAARIYDKKIVNIHIIQYLFYRWIRSIKCHSGSVSASAGLSSNSIVNMSINRKPDTGRPTDDFLYNVNSINYYHYTQPVSVSQSGSSSNHFGYDQQGVSPPSVNSSSSPDPSSSINSSSNSPPLGAISGIHSGYRINTTNNSSNHHHHRGNMVNISAEIQSSGPELQIPNRLGNLRSPNRSSHLNSSLGVGGVFGAVVTASNKVLITQEVMEEIYNGLSLVRNIKELLDIIHVTYKYIAQLLTVKCSMGGGDEIHGLRNIEITFPKNAGIKCSESRENLESDQNSWDMQETDERLLQEQMVKSCWELLEMEEAIDRYYGYYPYWTVEHERFIWIHNIRKLLSLVNNDYDNNLDYISCNSWIEWIPNLDLFDKSLYNKYKKSLLSERRSQNHLNPGIIGEEQQLLDFLLLARPVVSLDMKILCKMHQHCQTIIDQKLIQLLNIELCDQQIYKVVLFELLRQINFTDKAEFERDIEENLIKDDELRSRSMTLLGIKSLDISKMIPKYDSNIWSRTKISHSDSLDMIRFVSNSIKNLFAFVVLKYCFNRDDQVKLIGDHHDLETDLCQDPNYEDFYYSKFEKDEFKINNCENCEPSLIDLNNLYYSEEEFPFKVIEILLANILPIYTTSLDVFTKIQLNNSSNGGKNQIKLRLQSLFWYVDIIKQFLSGRILLLNKFNDISRFTIPMISGVFNSPTLNYEQEDFLRISCPFYFSNNYFGDLFWKLTKIQSDKTNFEAFNNYYSQKNGILKNKILRQNENKDMGTEQNMSQDLIMTNPLLLLQSSKLLGSWGSYYNIYSSPRYLIHVGPYDIPIPISSYLLLKPYYKLNLVNSLWNDIVKRLIDSKKRDGNGNSTANNGLTVHLNRNLAVTGGNPLKYSLLSQSTRQILQMLPEKLRITERPFLIVFRGEGSTDFGGPFQEFLSWISNEIMSKNNDNIDKTTVKNGGGGGAAAAAGGVGYVNGVAGGFTTNQMVMAGENQYYGLFTPCANALHSIGHNQDTVSINSIYSNYKTINSLYICEEFLLFGSGKGTGEDFQSESLLSKFKRDYYSRNSLLSGSYFGIENPEDYESGIQEEGGFVIQRAGYQIFKAIVSKIPSLRCNHSYSGNSKILTYTIESKIQSFLRRGGMDKENKNVDEVETENTREGEREAGEGVEGGVLLESEEEDTVRLRRTESRYALEEISLSSPSNSLSSSPSSNSTPVSIGSIPEELNNAESINNTNPTPITTHQEASHPNVVEENLGIMHKLDPWEWPKDKEMREIIGEMYECLGRLMGICVTTKSAMNINLNPLIWKKFSGLPLSLKDLVDADCIAYEMLNSLKYIENESLNTKQRITNREEREGAANIPEIEGLTFQIENMNGNITSLLNIDGGEMDSSVGVTLKNLHLFVQLAERCRMLDDTNIMTNILKGFGTIIPLGRMRMLFNYQKIEYLICGESKIDLATLKNHTVSPHPELKEQLFQVLETFNNEQLQKLLRFVSGRSRLPQVNNNCSDWKFSINYDNPDTIQDNRLPIATTCGFRLSLPKYSSIEILRSRLLYAINNCVAIDLDAYVTHDN